MYFKQIRSATIIIEYAGKKFLIDPWLAEKEAYPPKDRRNPLVELPISLNEILEVDAVIVTHTHFDHFDEVAKKIIPKEMKVFVQDKIDAAELNEYGFNNLEILQSDGIKFADITLFKTKCSHGQGEITEEQYKKLGLRGIYNACGVVFKKVEEKTVYIAGDTLWFDGVQKAIERHQPEVIILNTARAELPKGHPIIMGTNDIMAVYQAAPDAAIIASHMGVVKHATLTREDIKNFIKEYTLPNIWIPEDGESKFF